MTVDVYRHNGRTRVAIGIGDCEHILPPDAAHDLAVRIVIALTRDASIAADAEVESWQQPGTAVSALTPADISAALDCTLASDCLLPISASTQAQTTTFSRDTSHRESD